MGLLDTAKWVVREAISGRSEKETPEESETGELLKRATQIEQLRHDNRRLDRINQEYFGLIEQIERERNEWKDMYFTQSSEHQNAQSMIRNSALALAQNLGAAVVQLNIYRKAAGHEAVLEPQCLRELPVTAELPENYGKHLAELVAAKKPDTDAKAARSTILRASSGG